jgi:endoglucanase
MDILQVKGNRIVDSKGGAVRLRGTCVGGWMNMEHFINGYPGAEHTLRALMAEELGEGRAAFFFDRMLDYFLAEEDIEYLKSCGVSVVRLPLNYRHFESDGEPFRYLEAGFTRLDRVLGWCEKHGIRAILDLHSVQGWQNTDWHCDNASLHALFWGHPHFQDRFIALWREMARRYKGNGAVAGYNVMNEPVTNAVDGRVGFRPPSDWNAINSVYRRVVKSIREMDPDHIIFLEGDWFSSRFSGLEAPFADNLAYSSHNYTPPALSGERWTPEQHAEAFDRHEGTLYARKHNVPLWVGEFGALLEGSDEEKTARAKAFDEQIGTFEEFGAHWTSWTYKSIGPMSWVQAPAESGYVRLIASVLKAKALTGSDMGWLNPTPSTDIERGARDLARDVENAIQDPDLDVAGNRRYLPQTLLGGYVGRLMQPLYVKCFKGLSETEIDRILQSFALKNCRTNRGLVDVIGKYTA